MADLGDLSGFITEAAVSDLSWLDVNEQDYRDLDKLPKQNLDIAPDLERMWAHEDSAPSRLVPNKEAPKTMLDVGQKVSSEVLALVAKTARFALMQSSSTRAFQTALTSRFDKDVLSAARPTLASVLQERGLLGKWYISAEDFHACGRYSKTAKEFVRKFAGEARYILAKKDCPECVRLAGTTCSVFQKKIVLDIPYTDGLATQLEKTKLASGKAVVASTGSPRERIRAALLAKDVVVASVQAPKPIENTTRNLGTVQAPKRVHLKVLAGEEARLISAEQAWTPNASEGKTASNKTALDKKAFDIRATMRRELLKGRNEREVLQAVRLSHSVEDLQSTRSQWEPLFHEAGLFGSVYSTQMSFDDCNVGADFLAKHASSVKGIVAGEKCSGCFYNKMARCLLYGRKLVASKEELYTPEMVQQVIREQRTAGKLETGAEKVVWGSTPSEALKNIYRVANTSAPARGPRMNVETAFVGHSRQYVTAGLTKRDIVKTARKFQNEGLYGKDLSSALKRRFDPRDILAAKDELRPVVAEQGLQGIYYVDPTVYDDYGHGCNEAERLHRSRLVAYVKVGSACDSCVNQTNSRCSKLGGKQLVIEPPYEDKRAMQMEILSSGDSTSIPYDQLVNNGRSMLAEFGMSSSMNIDLDPVASAPEALMVDLGLGPVKL